MSSFEHSANGMIITVMRPLPALRFHEMGHGEKKNVSSILTRLDFHFILNFCQLMTGRFRVMAVYAAESRS